MTSKGEKGILTLYSDVQATSVRWLWYPFIAVGKITLLQGDPGDGKSTMMLGIENGLALNGDIRNVEHFAKRGVTSVQKMVCQIPSSPGWKSVGQIVGMWLL